MTATVITLADHRRQADTATARPASALACQVIPFPNLRAALRATADDSRTTADAAQADADGCAARLAAAMTRGATAGEMTVLRRLHHRARVAAALAHARAGRDYLRAM